MKNILWENNSENVHWKPVPDPFLILVNNTKKIRYFERGLSKYLNKVNFIFLSKPVPFNGKNNQKQKGPGISDQSLFRLQNKFRNTSLLVLYYLTKFIDVI